MKLDMVHDTQKAYRKLLMCMANPGTIESVEEESSNININIKFFKSTLVLMFMLLDSEVSFKIVAENEAEISKLVQQLTYSRPKNIDEADFIFVLKDADKTMLEESLSYAKAGDLINPHKAASVIIETSRISDEKKFSLKGPGIKDENYIDVQLDEVWVEKLYEKNIEFPLGIDMIFTDEDSNITCLPRTTKVLRKVN